MKFTKANPLPLTPCQLDEAITALMKSGMTGVAFQASLAGLRAQRDEAIKRLK